MTPGLIIFTQNWKTSQLKVVTRNFLNIHTVLCSLAVVTCCTLHSSCHLLEFLNKLYCDFYRLFQMIIGTEIKVW